MTINVRFAPSPTGKLHVGSLRPALINYLYARRHGGKFWLRLDDTDVERSRAEFAADIEHSLAWVGITWDHFARQSDRMERYAEAAEQLKAAGRLYPAFETPEQLALKRKVQLGQGLPPIYDRGALRLSEEERERLEAGGRRPHWRFRLDPGSIEWPDIVHGKMRFEAAALSDPVLIREDGTPLFILSGVVDDVDFAITHVIRGDDHIANTAVQIQIFEAMGGAIPVFGHTPLLLGTDGAKLSKRVGSLSVDELRQAEIEPMALMILLSRLGTSEDVTPTLGLQDLIESFELGHFNRAAARFDRVELERLSTKVLHNMAFMEAQPRLTARGLVDLDEAFWLAVRGNLEKFSDIDTWWLVAEGPVSPVLDDRDFIAMAAAHLPPEPWGEATWGQWTAALKQQSGRAGKALFLPLRQALTGADHGPEMRVLLPLIGGTRAAARLRGERA